VMKENGGVDIDSTLGFCQWVCITLALTLAIVPLMKHHKIGGAKELAVIRGIFYPPNPFAYMLGLVAFIPHVHYKDLKAIQKPCLPSRHPYRSVAVLSHPFSTRRIVVFFFPFPLLPHPPAECPDPFHPNLSQSVPITRRQPHSLVHNPQISAFLLPVLIDRFPENLAHCMCLFPFLNRVMEFPRLNLRPSDS
jgi:hypothetical protein